MLTHAGERGQMFADNLQHVGLTEVHLRHSRRRRKAITVRRSDFSRSSSFHVRVFCHLQLLFPLYFLPEIFRRFFGDRLVEEGFLFL